MTVPLTSGASAAARIDKAFYLLEEPMVVIRIKTYNRPNKINPTVFIAKLANM